MKLRKLLALAMAAVLAVSSASVALADGPDGLFELNGTRYGSLAEAIDDVPNGVETTITLTNSITEESAVTIPEGKNIVLDLGGFEYTLSGSASIDTGIDQNITTDVYALLNQGRFRSKVDRSL